MVDFDTNRRSFVKSGAAAVTVGLAGCLGNGGGNSGSESLVIGTSTSDSSAYAMSQGMASSVKSNSDLQVSSRATEGTVDSFGLWNQGDIDIGVMSNYMASQVEAGDEPYNNIQRTPNLLMHVYDLAWFACTPNSNMTSVTDIGGDTTVSLNPAGTTTRTYLHSALDKAVDDYEEISVEYSGLGSAMSEGRLDVGGILLFNFAQETAWAQEMKSTVDLGIMSWPDEVIQQIEEDPYLRTQTLSPDSFEGYQFIPDNPSAMTLIWWLMVANDMDYDTVYNFLETLWNNRQQFVDSHAVAAFYEENSWWTKNAINVPFHPAAADFYQEQGVWDESYTRGEE